MAFTIPQIINIAKYSQVLADDAASKGVVYKPVIDPMLGIKLYVIRKDVEQVYALDPNYAGLQQCANYLYGLCGMYALTAQAVISGGGGSSVIPGTPTIAPSPYQFIVSDTSFIPTGGTSKTISTFIGYNLIFARGGVTQSTENTGGTYYSWDKTTGLFTLLPSSGGEALVDELFQLFAV